MTSLCQQKTAPLSRMVLRSGLALGFSLATLPFTVRALSMLPLLPASWVDMNIGDFLCFFFFFFFVCWEKEIFIT